MHENTLHAFIVFDTKDSRMENNILACDIKCMLMWKICSFIYVVICFNIILITP